MPDALPSIVAFLIRIGLRVEQTVLAGVAVVLPGICVGAGTMLYDPIQLRYPGDLLHEAGHLAVMPPARRRSADGRLATGPAAEMTAIAWSYAAALDLGIDPACVFHHDGYRGGAAALLENFAAGRYVGVHTLVWLGLTRTPPVGSAGPDGVYPAMLGWLNESPRDLDADDDATER